MPDEEVIVGRSSRFSRTLLAVASACCALACLLPAPDADACTGITLTAQDKAHIVARSIEWGASKLESRLVVSGRGRAVQTTAAEGPGLSYVTRYGFVGVSILKDAYVVEGLNEKGLSAGLFFFPGCGGYPAYQAAEQSHTVSDMEFVAWMLSNFASVDEVKKAAPSIRLSAAIAEAGTLHFRAADESGAQIVIEVVDGVMHIYDNPLGVLTNSPDFPWQMKNLNNYLNLRAGPAAPAEWGAVKLQQFGMGAGLLGMPGDISPSSRFVRAAFLQATAPALQNARAAVVYSFTILNSFDIPIGLELSSKSEKTALVSATQWTSASDAGNRAFYYRTAQNPRIRAVDLKAIDFSRPRFDSRPLDDEDEAPIEKLDIR